MAGALVGAEARSLAEVGRQQRGQVVERRRHHPHRPDGVGLLGGLRVRQPLHPVPVGEVLLGGEHRDLEVLRRLERRRAADHRPGQRARLLLGAAHLDAVERAQVDRRGQVGQQPVHDQQPVQGRGGGRVDLVDDRRLRERPARARAAARTGRSGRAGSCGSEEWCSQTRDRSSASDGRARRRRVLPGQRAALLVGGFAGDLADVGEVAQVLGARPRHLLGALLPLPVDLHDDEARPWRTGTCRRRGSCGRRPRRRRCWRRARSSPGCRASGWRSSARRSRPRAARAAAAPGARSRRWASPAGPAARPEASCSRTAPLPKSR